MKFEIHVSGYDGQVAAPIAPHRLTIRAALFLGFGLTLGLWLFSGYYFTARVTDLQRDAARVTERYIRAQARVSAVRNQVLLASVFVRDALLDPDPESIVDYRIKLDESFRISRRALDQFEPVLATSPESERVDQLRRQISAFERTVLDVLGGDSTRWPVDALPLLRDRIMPQRAATVQMSEDVQSLTRAAYIDQQSATSAIYRVTQQRIWTQFGLAVAASFCIGLLAIRHVGRLEDELRARHEQDAQTSAELQRLSGELFTAQEDERRTIARELHDEVGQALTAIKMELSGASRPNAEAGQAQRAVRDARQMTEDVLQVVRDMSRLLHPAVLDDIGLVAAVDAYVREFRRRSDLSVEFVHTGMEPRIPVNAETAIYRVIQEALTNIARHANAHSCKVLLARTGSRVQVTIEDDGVGFAQEVLQTATRGIGLLGMRERIAKLHGQCVLDTAPGLGTRVLVTLNLDADAPPATGPAVGAVLGLVPHA